MSTVAIVSRKGGVGKTTLTVALADFLDAIYGKRVLLIDLDPQSSLTIACVGDERWHALEAARRTMADVFDAAAQGRSSPSCEVEVHRVTGARPTRLLPGTPRLADIEVETEEGASRWTNAADRYLVLRKALRSVVEEYDYVLIDCPSVLTWTVFNGLALSDGYIVPVMPTHVAVSGIEQTGRKISALGKQIDRTPRRYGTIVNRVDARASRQAAIIADLERSPEVAPVWKSRVRAGTRAEEGWMSPGPQTLLQRWGPLYGDLDALAQEFVRRIP